jgi:hypothetical protein
MLLVKMMYGSDYVVDKIEFMPNGELLLTWEEGTYVVHPGNVRAIVSNIENA